MAEAGASQPRLSSLLRIFFIAVPVLFFTGTRDPFLIKEVLARSAIWAMFLLLCARRFENGEPFKLPALTIPFAAFLFSIALSIKNAQIPMLTAQTLAEQTFLALFYFICAQVSDSKGFDRVESGIVWASLLAGTYGAMQHFGLDFIDWATHWDDRPGSTFGNPNFAAGWWAMATPIFLWRAATNPKKRALPLALAILCGANLFWTRTRGAWMAEAAALGVTAIYFVLSRRLKMKSSRAFGIALGVVLIAGGLGANFVLRRNAHDLSVAERIFKWKTAQAMVRDFPAFGIGGGNLKTNFALYQAKVNEEMKLSLKGTSESNVHNEYLQIASELGMFGLAGFLLIFAAWFVRLFKNAERIADERQSDLLGYSGAVLAFLFYSATNFPYRLVFNSCLLLFILAAGEKLIEHSHDKIRKPAPALWPARLAAIAAFAAVFFLWILPPLRADLARREADEAHRQRNWAVAIARYHDAIRLDYHRSERAAFDLGECYRQIGQVENALQAYAISVRLRNYGEVYNSMGNCYYLLRNFSEAIRCWQTAVQLGLPDPAAQEQTLKNIEAVRNLTQNPKAGVQ